MPDATLWLLVTPGARRDDERPAVAPTIRSWCVTLDDARPSDLDPDRWVPIRRRSAATTGDAEAELMLRALRAWPWLERIPSSLAQSPVGEAEYMAGRRGSVTTRPGPSKLWILVTSRNRLFAPSIVGAVIASGPPAAVWDADWITLRVGELDELRAWIDSDAPMLARWFP